MNSAVFSDPAFWLLVIFVIPLIIRVPIAVALGFSALVIVWGWDMGIGMISYNFFAGVAKFPLLAIPFFILAGYIMERAGIAARIIELMEALVGDKTGGLAVASVAVCTFWGAVSGSGPATVAALGLVLIPGMVKAGYDKAFASSAVAVTSGIAIVIPPSIAFIVYGGITDVSVPALFAGGFIPGLVVAGFILAAVVIISKKRGYHGVRRTKPMLQILKESFWGAMTPVVILGGIYGGIFTPTEAAAIAVFYGLFVGIFIYKTINSVKMLFEIFAQSHARHGHRHDRGHLRRPLQLGGVHCGSHRKGILALSLPFQQSRCHHAHDQHHPAFRGHAARRHLDLLRLPAFHAAHHRQFWLGSPLVRHSDDRQPRHRPGDTPPWPSTSMLPPISAT